MSESLRTFIYEQSTSAKHPYREELSLKDQTRLLIRRLLGFRMSQEGVADMQAHLSACIISSRITEKEITELEETLLAGGLPLEYREDILRGLEERIKVLASNETEKEMIMEPFLSPRLNIISRTTGEIMDILSSGLKRIRKRSGRESFKKEYECLRLYGTITNPSTHPNDAESALIEYECLIYRKARIESIRKNLNSSEGTKH